MHTVLLRNCSCDAETQTEGLSSVVFSCDEPVSRESFLELRSYSSFPKKDKLIKTAEVGVSAKPAQPLNNSVACSELTRILRAIRQEHRGADAMSRAQKRYAGLPSDTPPPDIEPYLNETQDWHFWEWWQEKVWSLMRP